MEKIYEGPLRSLERKLGLFSVVTISISSMIGSGIFVLPGLGYQVTGPSLFLAFILSAITILPAAMSKAELATAMPTSGGTYVYIERTFGPFAGTVAGLGLFFSILLKAAFALMGLGAYFYVLSSTDFMPTILSFLGMIVILNIFGVGKVGHFLSLFLAISIASLLVLIGFSLSKFNLSHFNILFPHGFDGLATATGLVFVSFAGVTKVAAIAEEVKDPKKNLPRGILLSLFVVTLLYAAVSLVLAGVFPMEQISGELKPIYNLAKSIGGGFAGAFMAIVAVMTMVNTSNAGILAGSRFPFAMSRDKLLPSVLGRLNQKSLTPVASIILSGLIVGGILLTLNVEKIAKLASAFMIMIYMVENLCIIVLREKRPQWYKPGYKAPFYPLLQILGIISGALLLKAMGEISGLAIIVMAVPGVLFYFLYSARKTTRKGVVSIKGKRADMVFARDLVPNEDFTKIENSANVVVCLFGKERSPDNLVEMGVALTDNGETEVTSLIEVPEQTTVQDLVEEPAENRSLRRRIRAMANDKHKIITFESIVTHDIAQSIYDISQCAHCEWLLIEYRGKSRGSLTFDNPIGWLKEHLHCHLAVFKDSGIRYIKKIMVLLNDDRNDATVLDTALHFAKVNKAGLTFCHWVSEKESEQDRELHRTQLEKIAGELNYTAKVEIICGKDQVSDIKKSSIEYDLLVMGSADHSFSKTVFGSFDDEILKKAACSVVAVHASSF